MAQTTTGLSSEEFQRIQESLLELRTSNYQLAEQSSKKDKEIANLEQKARRLEDELQKALKNKRSKGGDAMDFSESDALRHKLSTQEEEFRLQQATLITELQRVIAQQEELEKQVQDLKESGGNCMLVELETENAQLKSAMEESKAAYEREIGELSRELQSQKETTEIQSREREMANAKDYEASLDSAKNAAALLEQEKQSLVEKMNNQTEEFQLKSAVLQKEIVDLKEQLRRKQGSYVSLTEEKERQLEEFKKALDNMMQKKDGEVKAVVEELNSCKRQLQMARDSERMAAAEKASLETAFAETEHQMRKIREQNEGFQIRLQETNSANDCLSGQLQEARHEVERMQGQLEATDGLAANRKNLLDDLNQHLETLKEEFRKRENDLLLTHQREASNLMAELETAQKASSEITPLQQKALLLESLLQASEDRCNNLESELEQMKVGFESQVFKQEEFVNAQKILYEQQNDALRMELEAARSECERQLLDLTAEKDGYFGVIQELKQEVKDKEDGVKAVERKHHSVIKDLKRQLQLEKKRNDHLQEKLQDVAAAPESGRNKSPGNTSYEEIRPTELPDNRPRTGGDAGSVSSWTVVTGVQKDNDRHSVHTADHDSESSLTMLETENHELISRVTELQKRNFELQERIMLLEESSAAMAEDLVNKATIIEQFLKEKSAFHLGPSVSPEKLPPGLKKVIDLMKIDQSAVEIRDMNKRLQHMLEETLTKNMHLQKDLELMSQEVARLGTAVPREKQRLSTS